MQRFQIFKPGRHVSSAGNAIEFSAADVDAAVKAYDPAVHEAPIVVGHPRDNAPAYGWIKALSFSGGAIEAEATQVDEAFAEMVQKGRFKKRSASFYTPDSPNNPKPGSYYLRHVGFLGAQPPAVKGLKDVNFADADDGVVEFSDAAMVTGILAMFMRRMREFIIAEHGADRADSVLPDFLVGDIEAEARKPAEPLNPAPAAMPAFSEDSNMITPEQLAAEKARADKAEADLKTLQAQVASFSEREKSVAEREAKLQRSEVETRVDELIKAGKVLPAQRKATVDFAMSLQAGEASFDFGEGDQAKKVNQRDLYLKQIAAGPKLVEYGEKSPAEKAKEAEDLAEVQKRIADQVKNPAAPKK